MDAPGKPAGSSRLNGPGSGYACFQLGDFSTAFKERCEIYAAVRDANITGFITVCSSSHAFYAGLAAPSLQVFEAVGAAFVTSSISSVDFLEAVEHALPRTHPLRGLYLTGRTEDPGLASAGNLLLRHGVRAYLGYIETGDLPAARKLSNSEFAPHLSFVDLGGHGYAAVRASSDFLECEFVCIERPIERATSPAGGPLSYRVVHRVPIWKAGEAPRLEQQVLEGNPSLSL